MSHVLVPIPDITLVYIETKDVNHLVDWHPPLVLQRNFELVKVIDNTQNFYIPQTFNYQIFRGIFNQIMSRCFLVVIKRDFTVKYNGFGEVLQVEPTMWGKGVLETVREPSPAFVKYDTGNDGEILCPCTVLFYDSKDNSLQGQASWNANHCPILYQFLDCTYNYFMFNMLRIREAFVKKMMESLKVVVFFQGNVVRTISSRGDIKRQRIPCFYEIL